MGLFHHYASQSCKPDGTSLKFEVAASIGTCAYDRVNNKRVAWSPVELFRDSGRP
jgi:hypothetical protein